MPEFLDLKLIYLILHLFGVAIGAGGAYMSDAMYMFSVRDHKLLRTELKFLRLGSVMVWVGLGLLVVSGLLLLSLNPEMYLNSTKFLVKITIVGIIILNGLMFHFVHTPVLDRTVGKKLHRLKLFKNRSRAIYLSGALSMASWSVVIILGALRGIPYSYLEIFGVYLILVAVAMVGAEITRQRYIRGGTSTR